MRGLAGPCRVFTWQGRQTVQALGLSQSISCNTSLCLSSRRFQRGRLEQLSRQHHHHPRDWDDVDTLHADGLGIPDVEDEMEEEAQEEAEAAAAAAALQIPSPIPQALRRW